MHRFDHDGPDREFADAALHFARHRIEADAQVGGLPIGTPRTASSFDAELGRTITPEGAGGTEALRIFRDVLEPACLSIDHPGFLSFVPQAPSEVAVMADLIVSACGIYAGSWMEGGGAVWAENQALRWLADLAGFPETAGGVFVQGGTNGNLSALVAAREQARHTREGGRDVARWVVVCGEESHSSVTAMARVMDADVVIVPGERLTAEALRPVVAEHAPRIAAVVATAGTTNLGRVDRLAEVADVCAEHEVWMHVDGAYGIGALNAPSVRHRFDGIERADSFIVDPHKWLFTPFDSCALVYRDPARGRAAHTQKGAYLEVLTSSGDHNPSDYGVQLSRRARGVPLWFSLVTHGTDAYRDAIELSLQLARTTAEHVRAHPALTLLEEPELSVVAFTRDGWAKDDYQIWSDRLLADGIAFVVPSSHQGEPILRMCFLNPRTTIDLVDRILGTL